MKKHERGFLAKPMEEKILQLCGRYARERGGLKEGFWFAVDQQVYGKVALALFDLERILEFYTTERGKE